MKFRGKQKQLDREVARCFRLTRQPNSDGGPKTPVTSGAQRRRASPRHAPRGTTGVRIRPLGHFNFKMQLHAFHT